MISEIVISFNNYRNVDFPNLGPPKYQMLYPLFFWGQLLKLWEMMELHNSQRVNVFTVIDSRTRIDTNLGFTI